MITLPKIFGMPPKSHISDSIIEASMPVVTITPAEPTFQEGLTLFGIDSSAGISTFKSLLNNHDFQLHSANNGSIKAAFLADNFPTDSFRNEYGESFLDKITDTVSTGAGDLAQMFGADTVGETVKGITNALKKSDSTAANMLGSGISGANDIFNSALDAAEGLGGTPGRLFKGARQTLNKVLSGQRIDFPMVWKGSGFEPSYSLTIRLYNPCPGSLTATEQYIIGPIAAFLLLAVPRSDGGGTYTWPLLSKIKCDGIYDLNAAFISNITIVKGGDQQQIGWNHRLSIVDVRLDFGSLYGSMISSKNKNRPTVKSYIDVLRKEKTISTKANWIGNDITSTSTSTSTNENIYQKVATNTDITDNEIVSTRTTTEQLSKESNLKIDIA